MIAQNLNTKGQRGQKKGASRFCEVVILSEAKNPYGVLLPILLSTCQDLGMLRCAQHDITHEPYCNAKELTYEAAIS